MPSFLKRAARPGTPTSHSSKSSVRSKKSNKSNKSTGSKVKSMFRRSKKRKNNNVNAQEYEECSLDNSFARGLVEDVRSMAKSPPGEIDVRQRQHRSEQRSERQSRHLHRSTRQRSRSSRHRKNADLPREISLETACHLSFLDSIESGFSNCNINTFITDFIFPVEVDGNDTLLEESYTTYDDDIDEICCGQRGYYDEDIDGLAFGQRGFLECAIENTNTNDYVTEITGKKSHGNGVERRQRTNESRGSDGLAKRKSRANNSGSTQHRGSRQQQMSQSQIWLEEDGSTTSSTSGLRWYELWAG